MLSLISLLATILIYIACKKVYAKWHMPFLNPILTSLVVLLILLVFTHVSYSAYMGGGQLLTYMLGPATVSFAIPLYKNYKLLKKHAIEMILSIFLGTLLAIITTVLLARSLNLSVSIGYSLVPRSVTTPIAMEISHTIGGSSILTAVFTLITGISGTIIGPFLIRYLRLRSSAARGMLLGTAAHGLGTSTAFEFGHIEGTFASLSMILTAIFTIGLVPLLFNLIQLIFHS